MAILKFEGKHVSLIKSKRGTVPPITVQAQRTKQNIKTGIKNIKNAQKNLRKQVNNLKPRYNKALKDIKSNNVKIRNKARNDIRGLNKTKNKLKNEAKLLKKQSSDLKKALRKLTKVSPAVATGAKVAQGIKTADKFDTPLDNILKNIDELPKPPAPPKKPPGKPTPRVPPGTPKKPPGRPPKKPPTTPRRSPGKPPRRPPSKPPIKPPKIPKLKFDTDLPRGYRFKFDFNYRRLGKVKTQKVGLPENKALNKAITFIKRTPARSMELKISGITKVKDSSKPSLKDFRLRKTKNALILVEIPKSAIKGVQKLPKIRKSMKKHTKNSRKSSKKRSR